MNMKVYISGKISGLPMGVVTQKFKDAEDFLIKQGFEVVNPVKVDHSKNVEQCWKQYMQADIKAMMDCNYIALLPCWQDSPGAKIEFDLAVKLNYSIISLEGML